MKKVLAITLMLTSSYASALDMVMALDCKSGTAIFEKSDAGNKITAFGKVYPLSAGTERFVHEGKIVTGQYASINKAEIAGVLFSDQNLADGEVFLSAPGKKGEFCKITETKQY